MQTAPLINITVSETSGQSRHEEPVNIGVPFPQGIAQSTDCMTLTQPDGSPVIFDTKVSALWPDNSIKWALVSFLASCDPATSRTYWLNPTTEQHNAEQPTLSIHPDKVKGEITVSTGKLFTRIPKSVFSPTFRVEKADIDATFTASLQVKTQSGQYIKPSELTTTFTSGNNNTRCDIHQAGQFVFENGRACHFASNIRVFANSSAVEWDVTLHNQAAATHPGGLWDLGDPGSILLDGFEATLTCEKSSPFSTKIEPDQPWRENLRAFELNQASSGGKNWDSRNHINSAGQLPLAFKGYQFTSEKEHCSGERASPTIHMEGGLSLSLEGFWQNFPKSIHGQNNEITLGLFPSIHNGTFELQGGEKKTHRIHLDLGDKRNAITRATHPLEISLDPEYLASTATLLHFSTHDEPIDDIIQQGLKGPQSFVNKREVIDEYGWRNFGDIFADHESLYLEDGQAFVSHYNNQYDPLYGFLRQYLRTGNSHWFELAKDLARHINDIDIYDTNEDRAEYNGGLFWHTDHYVDAFTSSHRTYSHQQIIDGEQTQGGGPGAEHCYTHGLLLHYYLTGDEASKHSVLKLAKWITHFYEGTGSVTEQLLATKQLLPKLNSTLPSGKILNHRYPLDRGVGNYICALLDSYAITANKNTLAQVGQIIRGTVNPRDDLNDRYFSDPETTWFYTIFFQAVTRFIDIKRMHERPDDADTQFATASLLHYAAWMKEHESPYLRQPEKLDYPNDTWAAQDIRKANLLYYVSAICPPADQLSYKTKADEFYTYVTETLLASDTSHFSRIQAILMQNHGPHAFYVSANEPSATEQQANEPLDETPIETPYVNKYRLLLCGIRGLLKAMASFSVKRELAWLRHRHRVFAKLYRFIDR